MEFRPLASYFIHNTPLLMLKMFHSTCRLALKVSMTKSCCVQHVFSYMDESIQSPQEDQAYYISHSKLLLMICFLVENMLRDDTV